MTTSGTGAVFFLDSRAHYQVLEPSNNYDAENGNASTETIYQNPSVEELWPNEQTNKNGDLDANYNPDLKWTCSEQNNTECDNKTVRVKRRVKRRSSEALLCDNMKPTVLNHVDTSEEPKPKPRTSLLSFLTSFARRKRRLESEQVQYLQHIESVLTNCTYRESCRCLDCQSRYFECTEESDEFSSDEDFSPFSIHDVESQMPDELDDEVFLDSPVENDNASTDLLLEEEQAQEETVEEDQEEDDKQLQMEVAASTSAMFNILLYHPFSCVVQ